MVACVAIPGFELRAALRSRPRLALWPAALAPAAGGEPLLGPVTAAAGALGVRAGMRLGEALATCPGLVLVERDPAAAEQAWEGILRSLEDVGLAVESAELGCVYFETRGVERLYGGLEAALERALAGVGTAWDPRAGAAERRFAALAAANVARPGQILIVSDERTDEFLAPLPLELIPLEPRRQRELRELGVRRLGELAGLPQGAVAERSGPDGRRAWSLARGGAAADTGPPAARRGCGVARAPGSGRQRAGPAAGLHDAARAGAQQLELLPAAGAELDTRLGEGLRQVRASTGSGSVCTAAEAAPWSRLPEARALFVPRDD